MKTKYIGIDCGVNGAIAVYDPNNVSGNLIEVFNIPILTSKGPRKRNKITGKMMDSTRREIDALGVANLFQLILSGDFEFKIILELVKPMGNKNGAFSLYGMGRGMGIFQTVLAYEDQPFRLLSPKQWKKGAGLSVVQGLDRNEQKDLARQMARTYFPKQADLFKRKKDNDRAEAVLMARLASLPQSQGGPF